MNVRPPGRPEGEYSIAEEGREARRVLWSTTVWTKKDLRKRAKTGRVVMGMQQRPGVSGALRRVIVRAGKGG